MFGELNLKLIWGFNLEFYNIEKMNITNTKS